MPREDTSLSRHERQQLEREWQQRVAEAQRAYRAAAADLKDVITVMKNDGWQMNADGRQLLHEASNVEREAIKKYVQTLRAFTELVVHGVVPEGRTGTDGSGYR